MVEDQVGGAGEVTQVNPDTWTDDWSTKGVGDQITLEVDGSEHALPIADLDKANLEYQFEKA